jgi:hypothetical protein
LRCHEDDGGAEREQQCQQHDQHLRAR